MTTPRTQRTRPSSGCAARAATPAPTNSCSRAPRCTCTPSACCRSIEAGSPGFVSDRYLNAISAETSITALELCLAGLWERTSCGYRVSDADTLSVAEQIHGQLNELAARCTRDGGHIVDPQHPDVCAKCGSMLAITAGPQVRSHPGSAVRSEIEYRPRHRDIDAPGADAADAA